MVTKQMQQKIIQELTGPLETAFTAVMLEVLQDKHPDTDFQNIPLTGITVIVDEYTDQWTKHYSGKTNTRPTAKSIQKAIASRIKREEEGTVAEKWATPDVIEKWIEKVSMPGSIQRHLPSKITIK
jgi:hypothetical protein